MTNYEKRFENLAEFLTDAEAMPINIVITELQSEDVNVAKIVAEVNAITEEPVRVCSAIRFVGNLKKRSKEELLKLLEDLESGPFGRYDSTSASAAARGRDLTGLSERELRHQIERLQEKHPRDDGDAPSNAE
jgi:hypothetical protein